jgi:hypothetical protein
MLSEIETSGSATAFVGSDAVDETCPVLAAPGGAFRSAGNGSRPASDSFFDVAMRPRPRIRVGRRDRRPLSA